MDDYRHDLNEDDTETLCGISPDDAPNLAISCACGHPDCELPVTCPACIEIKTGKVN